MTTAGSNDSQSAAANKAQLTYALEAAAIGTWSWEIATGLMICNEISARLYEIDVATAVSGITRDEFLQRIQPEDRSAFSGTPSERLNADGFIEVEYRIQQSNGAVRWLQSRGRPSYDDDGEITHMQGVVADITGRKSSEAALRRTTQLLEASQAIAKLGGWELDIDSGELFWTDETYRIHDTSPAEFNPTLEAGVGYFLPKSQQIITAALQLATSEGKGYDLELETFTTKGRLINVRTTCVVSFRHGRPWRLTGIFQDITERKRAEQETLEREARYRMLLEGTKDLVSILDADGRFTYVNHQAAAYFGISVEDCIGRSADEFIHPNDLPAILDWIAQSAASGARQAAFEIRLLDFEGAYKHFLWSVELHYDGAENLNQIRSIAHNTTDRRQADEQHARLAAIVEWTDDAIISRDRNGICTSWNAGAEKLFGYTADEMIGGTTERLLPPDLSGEAEKIIDRIQSGEVVARFETVRIHKSGRPIELSAVISPIKDANHHVVGASAIFRDVTERNQAEAAAHENQARLQLAMEVASIGTWERDLVNKTVKYSSEWKAQLGFSDAEIGTDIDEFSSRVHPDDVHLLPPIMAEIRKHPGVSLDADYRMRHKDGTYRWIHAQVMAFAGADGRSNRTIGVHRDRTEKHLAEMQAFRSQRLESLGTLAGGIAHDLNNALAPILMGVDLLRTEYPNGSSTLDLIESNALRGANMVKQLVSFPKGLVGRHREVRIEPIVAEMQSLMAATFPKNLTLQVGCEPDLCAISGDATQLEQILLNLCVNARDAMPDGGTLTLHAAQKMLDKPPTGTVLNGSSGHHILLSVTDTGAGIDDTIVENIFDPFFSTKEAHKGTGLGLSTVLGITKGHGGFIKVNSVAGEGTTFTIYLPSKDKPSIAAAEVKDDGIPLGQGQVVLFVDDERALREVVSQTLANLNYQPLTAVDGVDGLAKAMDQNNNISAIITDLHMPNMDGRAMIMALKQQRLDIPALVVSGRLDDDAIAELKAAGATAVLAKPFNKQQLAIALATLK